MRLVLFVGSAGLLLLSLLFGGGAARGLLTDLAPQVVAALLLVVVMPGVWADQRASRATWTLFAGAIFLALIHILPLPPWLWGSLPGRASVSSIFETARVPAPWLPVALLPGEAVRSILSLLPAVAVFLAVLRLSTDERAFLVRIVVVVGVASVPLGMLQLLGGSGSGLYFYEITNRGRSVGFFANANHYIALLYCTLPLAAAVMVGRRDEAWSLQLALLGGLAFVILLGLSASGSRTALVLGGVSLLASYLLLAPKSLFKGSSLMQRAMWMALAALMILPVAMGLGLDAIIGRIEAQGFEDARWSLAPTAWRAALNYAPFGAGWGSFERIYQLHEDLAALIPTIVNHAHNDWLELFVEGGAPVVVLLAGWLIWLGREARTALWAGSSLAERMAKGAIIVLFLLSIHSFWDYPLRTGALSVLLALCCALTQPAPVWTGIFRETPAPRASRGRKRHKRPNSSAIPSWTRPFSR